MAPRPAAGGASRGGSRERSAEDFDIIIGFLGFWALVLVIVTVVVQLSGQNAAGWSLTLLAVVLATWGMVKLRRRLPSRTGRRHN